MGLYMLGLALYPPADRRRRLALVSALRRLPEAVQQALAMAPQLERLGAGMASAEHAFIIGKGTNYPTALEGALKFKEVAYLHAEGYASGELKHGPSSRSSAPKPPSSPSCRATTPTTACSSL